MNFSKVMHNPLRALDRAGYIIVRKYHNIERVLHSFYSLIMIELERKQARRQVSLSFIACFKHINIGGKLHIMNIMDSEQENCVGILLNHCEYILICFYSA